MRKTLHMRTTKVSLLGYQITVHEKTDTLQMGPNHEITVALRSAVGEPDENGVRLKPEGIANVLDAIPSVAIYQIRSDAGHGVMVLKEPE